MTYTWTLPYNPIRRTILRSVQCIDIGTNIAINFLLVHEMKIFPILGNILRNMM